MKFFLDTANVREIEQAVEMGVLDGVTTNPTLLAKEGRDPVQVLKEICKLVDGPVNAEVISTDSEGMIKEARRWAELSDNIVVKIPMTREGMKAVRALSEEGIPTNVTLVFSPSQALMLRKLGRTTSARLWGGWTTAVKRAWSSSPRSSRSLIITALRQK
jgi:transaldolase